jgi:hypothetical protein
MRQWPRPICQITKQPPAHDLFFGSAKPQLE